MRRPRSSWSTLSQLTGKERGCLPVVTERLRISKPLQS